MLGVYARARVRAAREWWRDPAGRQNMLSTPRNCMLACQDWSSLLEMITSASYAKVGGVAAAAVDSCAVLCCPRLLHSSQGHDRLSSRLWAPVRAALHTLEGEVSQQVDGVAMTPAGGLVNPLVNERV